jgi:hypothetical protein
MGSTNYWSASNDLVQGNGAVLTLTLPTPTSSSTGSTGSASTRLFGRKNQSSNGDPVDPVVIIDDQTPIVTALGDRLSKIILSRNIKLIGKNYYIDNTFTDMLTIFNCDYMNG